MTAYATEIMTDYGTRKDYRTAFDVDRFAADLAKELGGTVLPVDPDRISTDNHRRVQLDPQTALDIYGGRTYERLANFKVHVCIAALGVAHADKNWHDKTHKTADAYVRPDARPIASIAKDIKRRVIDASADALAKQRERGSQRCETRATMAETAAAFLAAFPGAHCRIADDGQQAGVNSGSSGHHFNGTLYADGQVSVQHFGSMSGEQFRAVLAILNAKPKPHVFVGVGYCPTCKHYGEDCTGTR